MKRKKGFTLIEILISTALMAIAIGGIFQVFTALMQLSETNENLTLCNNFAQGIVNEIRNVEFEDISADYKNKKFICNDLAAKGIAHQGLITVTDIDPGFLVRVKVIICWQDKNRIIGEDKNLNGNLNGGEDLNGNGELDSPCSIETAIMDKSV